MEVEHNVFPWAFCVCDKREKNKSGRNLPASWEFMEF